MRTLHWWSKDNLCGIPNWLAHPLFAMSQKGWYFPAYQSMQFHLKYCYLPLSKILLDIINSSLYQESMQSTSSCIDQHVPWYSRSVQSFASRILYGKHIFMLHGKIWFKGGSVEFPHQSRTTEWRGVTLLCSGSKEPCLSTLSSLLLDRNYLLGNGWS